MRTLASIACLLIAVPSAAQSDAAPYRALGTEPFWSLTIDAATIRYEPATGRAITVARPRPVVGVDGDRYRTSRITVDIAHMPCSDGMSDRRYADTVRVRIGGRELRGCGGAIAGQGVTSPLAGTWHIDLVGGHPVRLQQPATLSFAGDRVSGRICNAFGGSYRVVRGTLTTREIIGTQMACVGGGTQVETAVFAALRRPLRIHRGSRPDTLVLSDGRASITLRRSPKG